MPLLVFWDCFNSLGKQGSGEATGRSEGQFTSLVAPKTAVPGSPGGVRLEKIICGNRTDGSSNGLGLSSDKQGGNGSSTFLGGIGLSENMLGGNGSGEEGADTYGEDGAQDGEGRVLTPGDGDRGTASGTGSGHGTVQES